MKVIYSYDYCEVDNEKTGIREISYEGTTMSVTIQKITNHSEDKTTKKVYGVNWSAMGTVKVEEAEAYIKLIQEAVEIAKMRSGI